MHWRKTGRSCRPLKGKGAIWRGMTDLIEEGAGAMERRREERRDVDWRRQHHSDLKDETGLTCLGEVLVSTDVGGESRDGQNESTGGEKCSLI